MPSRPCRSSGGASADVADSRGTFTTSRTPQAPLAYCNPRQLLTDSALLSSLRGGRVIVQQLPFCPLHHQPCVVCFGSTSRLSAKRVQRRASIFVANEPNSNQPVDIMPPPLLVASQSLVRCRQCGEQSATSLFLGDSCLRLRWIRSSHTPAGDVKAPLSCSEASDPRSGEHVISRVVRQP